MSQVHRKAPSWHNPPLLSHDMLPSLHPAPIHPGSHAQQTRMERLYPEARAAPLTPVQRNGRGHGGPSDRRPATRAATFGLWVRTRCTLQCEARGPAIGGSVCKRPAGSRARTVSVEGQRRATLIRNAPERSPFSRGASPEDSGRRDPRRRALTQPLGAVGAVPHGAGRRLHGLGALQKTRRERGEASGRKGGAQRGEGGSMMGRSASISAERPVSRRASCARTTVDPGVSTAP
eukprot:352159-Chlamydomonas_euryale.AAC.3